MLKVLANRIYGRLFVAQVVALLGTGLLTVALGLLAYDLAGERAGAVLGTALAIKMVAYVSVAPVVGAFAAQLPRRAFLIAMDLVRAAIALLLPFITEVWQIYALIFILQSASAAFTPTFQATIPDVLTDEEDYTKALSLSRLAYDLESIVSPVLAAALLSVISFHWLFAGTVVGFFASAALVFSVALPSPQLAERQGGIYDRTTRGIRIYLATPQLRGLLALNMAVAIGGALVIVNTVVIVKGRLGLDDHAVALALGCFGGGSMLAALTLPRVLERVSDRTVMLTAALMLSAVLATFAAILTAIDGTSGASAAWGILLATWAFIGLGYSATQTPSGRLLRRSAHAEDRPALFAAQFALSHACWLVTYPLAGWLGATLPLHVLAALFGAMTLGAVCLAARLWPGVTADELPHEHPELPAGHPHLAQHRSPHAHPIVIDDLHPRWPARAA